MKSFKIILASSSPRRIFLLKQQGLRLQIRSPQTDETPRKGESPRAMVRRLAIEKANDVAGRTLSGKKISALVIAADTTVVGPNGRTVFGKPKNAAEARRMLSQLVGRTHQVFTGYCILVWSSGRCQRRISRVVGTRVTMRKISPAQIRDYVRSGEPMDKAGAYAAQGIGMGLIEKISGSYTNVVGLPISQLMEDLGGYL